MPIFNLKEMGKGTDRRGSDRDDVGSESGGGEVIAFSEFKSTPIEIAPEPELPTRSPQEELLGIFDRWGQQQVGRPRSLQERIQLRSHLLDLSRRLAVAVFCAESMGYTPYFDESKGNAAQRLNKMLVDLKDPGKLREIVRHFYENGRGVMVLSSPSLTRNDPWGGFPLANGLHDGHSTSKRRDLGGQTSSE